MDLKSIFRMEMFKNFNDRTYLTVIAILTIVVAATSFTGLYFINNKETYPDTVFMFVPLFIFSIIGLWAFSILYPFHLLNMDYKNNVIGLIFASGVSRAKYYLVKVGATILCSFIAIFIIMIIPAVTYLIVYQDEFIIAMRLIASNFKVASILPLLLYSIMSLLSSIVTLTTSVIMTKGKFVGIFLSFLFALISNSVINVIVKPLSRDFYVNFSLDYLYINAGLLFLNTCLFVFIGLRTLKRQNL